jgi:hypothetical protein
VATLAAGDFPKAGQSFSNSSLSCRKAGTVAVKATPETGGRKSRRARSMSRLDRAIPFALLPCVISDISINGAQFCLNERRHIPDRFAVRLTQDGRVRRNRRVVWQRAGRVGVCFQEATETCEI